MTTNLSFFIINALSMRFGDQAAQAVNYFEYLLTARHTFGHGIHSPYVFELVSKVLFDKTKYPEYDRMDELRKDLTRADEVIKVNNIGAGSRKFSGETRKISDLVRISSVRPKFQRLFFRLARYYKPETILELGTSVGMSAFSFQLGNPSATVITVEAESSLCRFAKKIFQQNNMLNIRVRQGFFKEELPKIPDEFPVPGIVFIDGDHAYEPTLHYYKTFKDQLSEGLIIFDDIYWSEEMRRAWKEIQAGSDVTLDLFYMGFVIIRPRITPGHYRIRF